MPMMRNSILLLAFVFLSYFSHAQDRHTLNYDSAFAEADENAELFSEVSDLDPQRAALLSAVLPGLGQIYNHQYWKVPIIISGMMVFGHYINYNNKVYHSLRNAALSNKSAGINPYENVMSTTEALVRNRDIIRRNRDFMLVLGSAFYLFQVVDAHVSAHLDEFAVNKDLALRVEPSIESTPLFSQAVGVSLVLSF